jgi:membrane protease YdiL (CAAX protease family)
MKLPTREILAVFATALLFQLFANLLGYKILYLVVATSGWLVYVVLRIRRDRSVLADWGLRRDTLAEGTRRTLVVLLIGVALITLWRLVRGWVPLPLDAIGVFALYPIWSLIQEFVVQALLVANFKKLGLGDRPTIVAGGILFSLAHFPDPELIALTLLPGFLWAWLFLKTRSLLPISLCHAWLGTLAFYWILERDPWSKITGIVS